MKFSVSIKDTKYYMCSATAMDMQQLRMYLYMYVCVCVYVSVYLFFSIVVTYILYWYMKWKNYNHKSFMKVPFCKENDSCLIYFHIKLILKQKKSIKIM